MTETEVGVPTKAGTPNLNKALSQLQGKLPKVTKAKDVKVQGKEGKAGFEYSYATLADVTQAVGPLLAEFGLAFHCAPTVNPADQQLMILRWSLLHESGEERCGEWPLGPVRQAPQSLGSAVTYARRYCLGAATGVVTEDDDDGQRSQQDHGSRQSAGDAWEKSTPVPPRQNAGQRGQVSRPEQPKPAAEADPDEVDIDAQAYADEAHQALIVRDVEDIHKRAREAGKVAALVRNPAGGGVGKLAVYLDWRRKQLKETDEALNDLNKAAEETGFPVAELETHVKSVTGADLDSANAGQLRHATQVLRTMQGAAA